MPTAKPRITITLSDDQHRVLSNLSRLQKVSMSSIVVDFLDTAFPVLERLSAVLENAATAPQSVLDELKRAAEQAEHDAIGHGEAVRGQLDFLVAASAGSAALRELDAEPAEAAPVDRPPTSNRGVRISAPPPGQESIPLKKARRK